MVARRDRVCLQSWGARSTRRAGKTWRCFFQVALGGQAGFGVPHAVEGGDRHRTMLRGLAVLVEQCQHGRGCVGATTPNHIALDDPCACASQQAGGGESDAVLLIEALKYVGPVHAFFVGIFGLDGIQVERDVDHGAQHLVFLAQEITHMGLRLFGCDHHHSARAISPRGTTTWNLGNQLLNRLEQGLAYIHAALLRDGCGALSRHACATRSPCRSSSATTRRGVELLGSRECSNLIGFSDHTHQHDRAIAVLPRHGKRVGQVIEKVTQTAIPAHVDRIDGNLGGGRHCAFRRALVQASPSRKWQSGQWSR